MQCVDDKMNSDIQEIMADEDEEVRCSGMLLAHSFFIYHLSRDTSGFICGLFATCELC